jgi:hypothetical protein
MYDLETHIIPILLKVCKVAGSVPDKVIVFFN